MKIWGELKEVESKEGVSWHCRNNIWAKKSAATGWHRCLLAHNLVPTRFSCSKLPEGLSSVRGLALAGLLFGGHRSKAERIFFSF